jgi:hypothetical protein
MHIVKKLLFVGQEQVKDNFLGQLGVEVNPHPLLKIGLNVEPIEYQGKKYNIWTAHEKSTDENVLMWGKNSNMVVVFGDHTWYQRCLNLFPHTKVQMFEPNSIITNLEP